MILEHLLKKSDFERYVKSIELPDYIIDRPFNSIKWEDDDFLADCVKRAKVLGSFCTDNHYARIEKRKLARKALSYLCRYNYSCDDVFEQLYSKKNPNYEQTIIDLKKKFKDDMLLRKQYIWAFQQIFQLEHELQRVFDWFEKLAKEAECPNQKNEISDVLYAIDFLNRTDYLEGKPETEKVSILNLGIYLRNKHLSVLNNPVDECNIIDLWLKRNYTSLSISSLRKLGDLLCDYYKDLYRDEIDAYRREKKNNYNRKRYNPQKKLSAQDKRRMINELKSNGYTQKETTSVLGFSRSTVERYWNK